MENAQEQEDEIEALKAIFEGALQDLGGGTYRLKVTPNVDEPIPLVCYCGPEPAAPEVSTNSDHSDTSINTIKHISDDTVSSLSPLTHLAPILLDFSYPPDYPETAAPETELHCSWLSSEQLQLLQALLVEQYEEGFVCIFTWHSFLADEALEALQLSTQLRVCCLDHAQMLETAAAMIELDNTCKSGHFMSQLQSCGICLDERLGSEFIVLGCRHAYCADCIGQFLAVHINEGSINHIKCPTMDCGAQIAQHCVQETVSSEQFKRFENLQLQQTLQVKPRAVHSATTPTVHAMPDIFWCPRCNGPAIKDDGDLASCEPCRFDFCVLCGSSWHPGVQCMSLEARAELLAKRAKGSYSAEDAADLARKHADMVSQAESEVLIRADTKPCPQCNTRIHKISGCNKMHCEVCDCSFCWLCLMIIDGYAHFRASEDGTRASECAGQLFHGTEMEEQGRVQFRPRAAQQYQQQVRLKKCTRCKQLCMKENKLNHMRCWNCPAHFCYLCSAIVTNASHFSKKGCLQHSND